MTSFRKYLYGRSWPRECGNSISRMTRRDFSHAVAVIEVEMMFAFTHYHPLISGMLCSPTLFGSSLVFKQPRLAAAGRCSEEQTFIDVPMRYEQSLRERGMPTDPTTRGERSLTARGSADAWSALRRVVSLKIAAAVA